MSLWTITRVDFCESSLLYSGFSGIGFDSPADRGGQAAGASKAGCSN